MCQLVNPFLNYVSDKAWSLAMRKSFSVKTKKFISVTLPAMSFRQTPVGLQIESVSHFAMNKLTYQFGKLYVDNIVS